MIDNRPILFFDSGVGGLTTLKACAKLLPNEKYVYYADDKNLPYGNKTPKTLKTAIIKTISALIKQQNPKLVVVACNTATALVLQKLRQLFLSVLFVGTEPSIVPALKQCQKPLVLCTKNTKNASRILKLCKAYKQIEVFCPTELATLVEQNFETPEKLVPYLSSTLKRFLGNVDCVVLGCTHYVFLKKQISQIFGRDVCVLDGNNGVASRVKNCLRFFDIFNNDGGIRFLNKGKTYTKLVCAYTKILGGD